MNPLRIEIGGGQSKAYKSIDHLVWENVPPFVVLTGINGSGKTQLLEFLAYRLTGTHIPDIPDLPGITLKIEGDTFGPESVAFVPSRLTISGDPVVSLAEMQGLKQQLYNQSSPGLQMQDISQARRGARIRSVLGWNAKTPIDLETFNKKLPDDLAFMIDEADATAGIGHVFLGYRLRVAQHRELGISEAEIRLKDGPPPWEVLNETFVTAGFPFRVSSPAGTDLLEHYRVRLEDTGTGRALRPSDLSSGEQMLLTVVTWIYGSQNHGRFPKLFLLDEPDAHLHPSLTRQLLSVLYDVLSRRYGVRVIMTTHSPSTVALAPEDAVFEMSRSAPRVIKVMSRAETIARLTAGLVVVSAGMRHVLVEDEDDVAFYEMVRNVLSDYGPTKDGRAIKAVPAIEFVAASLGTGRHKIAGGKSVVTQWLEKLNGVPLTELFRGAIDRDSGNQPTDRLAVLSRYSVENYYLDPFVVFGLLSDNGTPPVVVDLTIAKGQEHLIRSLSRDVLQKIINVISALIEPELGNRSAADDALVSVKFTNGITVDYPAWMIDRRGHDLLPIYQKVLGGPKLVSPPRLASSFMRVRMIPADLADLMDKLQS